MSLRYCTGYYIGSRMPQSQLKAEQAIIEQYHQDSINSGARIREKTSHRGQRLDGYVGANGFINHPDNHEFTNRATS